MLKRLTLRSFLFLLAGVTSATIGLKGFLLPNHFLDGGITGISLLISRLTGIELAILIVCINMPFIYIGARQVGKGFAMKTACSILVLALGVHFSHIPMLTKDPLLIAVFGGFFIGAGI